MTFQKRPKGERESIYLGRKSISSRWKSKCKALREEHTALLWETARKPAWLEGRDSGEGHMR